MSAINSVHIHGLKQVRRSLLWGAMLMAPALASAQFEVTSQYGTLKSVSVEQIDFAGGGGTSQIDEQIEKLENRTSGRQQIEVSTRIEAPYQSNFQTLPTTAALATVVSGDEIAIELNASVQGYYQAGSPLNGWRTNGSGLIDVDVYMYFDVSTRSDVRLAFDHVSFANEAGIDSLNEGTQLTLSKMSDGQPSGSFESIWSHTSSADPGRPDYPANVADKMSFLTLDSGRYELALQYTAGTGYRIAYSALPQARDLSFRISAVPEVSTVAMWALGGLFMGLARRGRTCKLA